jgi:hypothetical protein
LPIPYRISICGLCNFLRGKKLSQKLKFWESLLEEFLTTTDTKNTKVFVGTLHFYSSFVPFESVVVVFLPKHPPVRPEA